ncbi:MAG: DNRLRE domain-containing protein [Oceanipulchritudo sp.]
MMKMHSRNPVVLAVSVLFVSPAFLTAQDLETVTLEPVRDNTIYSEGEKSNGQGSYLFTGQNNRGQNRRALLAFDVSSLPGNARIEAATLTLAMNKTITSESSVNLYRLTRDWGEGASDAAAEEGRGISAEEGDATWEQAFYPSDSWSNPGGDFMDEPSASTGVGGTATYAWESEAMVADVQAWIEDPSANHGWILVGNESETSAKRFESRHAANASSRPVLEVSYTAGEGGQNWAGYPVESDGVSVNTESFLGWVDIDKAPWVYIYALETYMFLPEENVSSAGGWAYVPN